MLQIAEVFGPTIQGEGLFCGETVSFIRLMKCGMNCSFCDTRATWDPSAPVPDTYIRKDLKSEDDIEQFITKYTNVIFSKSKNVRHIVISGGEPLLYSNFDKNLLPILINKCLSRDIDKITIETTMLSNPIRDIHGSSFAKKMSWLEGIFDKVQDKLIFSISPKFPLSCYPKDSDIDQNKIWKFYCDYDSSSVYEFNWYYKFVYHKNYEKYFMPILNSMPKKFKSKVCFMPLTPGNLEGENLEKYKRNCVEAAEFCKEYGVRYSPRIHIDLWGLKHGV